MGGIGQQPFQLGVLGLQRLQPLDLRDIQPAILALPVVEGGLSDPVLTTLIRGLRPELVLLQYCDNLLVLRS